MIQLEEIGDFSTYFNFHCDIEKMEEIGGIRHSAIIDKMKKLKQ